MTELCDAVAEILSVITQGRIVTTRADTPLLAGPGALDSVEVLELVVALEERLGVALVAADLVPEHLGSVGQLVALLKTRGA